MDAFVNFSREQKILLQQAYVESLSALKGLF